MVLVETRVNIIDNTSLVKGRCIHIYNGSKNKWADVGEFILLSIVKYNGKKQLKTKLVLGLVVGVKRNSFRLSGNFIKFDANQVVVFSDRKKESLMGNKILSCVSADIQNRYKFEDPLLMGNFI